jgi:hypothetical protein
MKGYPRREFVLRALAACGASLLTPNALVGGAGAQHSPASSLASQATQVAAGYFGGVADAARRVGRVYLRQLNTGTDLSSILSSARATLRMTERASSQDTAIEAIIAAVRRDFRDGRTVQVDGWILSRTEAELCALSLLPAAAP